MISQAYQKLFDYHMQCRHYNDEYKAYEKEPYLQMMEQLRRTFSLLYCVNLETGDVCVPAGVTDEDYDRAYEALAAARNALSPLHDPEKDKILLWEGDNIPWDAPGREEWLRNSYDAEDFKPHLVPFPSKQEGIHPAVIVMAGSTRLNIPEGYPPAEVFSSRGYHAFVLNNRIAHGAKARASMNRAMDLQRAVRLVRARAKEFLVDPERIYILCCSLGNRAAVDLFNTLDLRSVPSRRDPFYLPDAIDRVPCKIRGYISLYPAVFSYDLEALRFGDFPPVFAVMGNEDRSLWRMMPFFYKLVMGNVPVELHLYDGAGHGFSVGDEDFALGNKERASAAYEEWTGLLFQWLKRQDER